jgi:hypothetical protein
VTGWERPTPPTPDGSPPPSHWSRPSSADPLSPGQLIRRAWRLYRATPRPLLRVALVPEMIRDLLALPGLVISGLAIQALVDVMADFFARAIADPQAYASGDSLALEAELQAQLQAAILPQPDLVALAALGGGLSVAIGLVGSAALTAAALAKAAGRPISIAGAFRLVAARGGLVKPLVAIGIGWVSVSWLTIALQASPELQAWAGAPGSPRIILIGSLLAILGLVVTVGFVVLAVRWALYIPAVLVESLGIRPGLARAARLSSGIRIRLGLALAGILILAALSVGIVATVVGFAIGIAAGSVWAGYVAYVIASLAGNLLWAPMVPAMVAEAYRERAPEAAADAAVSST